ncbi:MAG: 3'-5' exonuclease [Cardiobacteriaceae bacterium]|nr:3'-5' exonuclease [Cardiobacteriaceae bacterium]
MSGQVLVFDIETVADTAAFRLVNKIPADTSEQEVLAAMNAERLSEVGNTFHRHHMHRVVCISLLLADIYQGKIQLWTLGRNHSEAEILQRFFAGIDKFLPSLVSWNGTGFDLPVLHYRALLHGIRAQNYFANGEDSQPIGRVSGFRYNNYLSRYHWRHLDLMDILSGYSPRALASLNDIAKFCGFPGKLETDGSKVQDLFSVGDIKAICDYCETDVLNTYGVYLRFELMRGNLDNTLYRANLDLLAGYLQKLSQDADKKHIQEFITAWQNYSVKKYALYSENPQKSPQKDENLGDELQKTQEKLKNEQENPTSAQKQKAAQELKTNNEQKSNGEN